MAGRTGALTRAVAGAAPDKSDPAAVLAVAYAAAIDRATHVPAALATALETLRITAAAADDDGKALKAHKQVTDALAAATILDRLGPKLVATLDVLLLTPKSLATLGVAPAGPLAPEPEPDADQEPAVTKLDELRARHGTRRQRAAG